MFGLRFIFFNPSYPRFYTITPVECSICWCWLPFSLQAAVRFLGKVSFRCTGIRFENRECFVRPHAHRTHSAEKYFLDFGLCRSETPQDVMIWGRSYCSLHWRFIIYLNAVITLQVKVTICRM